MSKIKKYYFHIWSNDFITEFDKAFFSQICESNEKLIILRNLKKHYENTSGIEIIINRLCIKIFVNTLNSRTKIVSFNPVY
jgi:hypothetical protein